MISSKILVKKALETVKSGGATSFISPSEIIHVEPALKKAHITYKKFVPFIGADKVVFYTDDAKVVLFKIETNFVLTHREILGSLYAFGIDEHTYGDIVINDGYYLYATESMADVLEYTLNEIGNKSVKLKRIPLEDMVYERKYETININAKSIRLDAVCAKLIHSSRNIISDKLVDKEILLNYEAVNKTRQLKTNDTLSIRKYGKYKIGEIEEKNNKYYIEILKYV